MEPVVVRLGDFDELCRHPFVFMTSEGYFDLPAGEERNFREFLERGGFILADDCVYLAREDRFFRDYRKLVNKLFPDNPMRKIPTTTRSTTCTSTSRTARPTCRACPTGRTACLSAARGGS
jgi:hypothetical protein